MEGMPFPLWQVVAGTESGVLHDADLFPGKPGGGEKHRIESGPLIRRTLVRLNFEALIVARGAQEIFS